ncbi:MAG: hypothetical protein NTX36_13355 [Proteobacteria bacterium]|nr:hypothetical protein [Pseudomonadota bacterium]
MLRKRNILFIISAIILIPIILGLTPVKFVQKLGSGCPFNKDKTALSCTACMYNSVTSQNHIGDFALAGLSSTPFAFQSLSPLLGETVDSAVTIIPHPFSEAPPLRC